MFTWLYITKISEYLDEVEVNLYYQITNRFEEFMKVIINLNEMTKEIDSSIHNIKNLRYLDVFM